MARQEHNDALLQTSFLYGANAAYIEDLYAKYQADPASVDAEWQAVESRIVAHTGKKVTPFEE